MVYPYMVCGAKGDGIGVAIRNPHVSQYDVVLVACIETQLADGDALASTDDGLVAAYRHIVIFAVSTLTDVAIADDVVFDNDDTGVAALGIMGQLLARGNSYHGALSATRGALGVEVMVVGESDESAMIVISLCITHYATAGHGDGGSEGL